MKTDKYWILTRRQVEKLIDELHRKEKLELLARFDLGAKRHGNRPLDLRKRRWQEQGHEERLDEKMYLEVFLPEFMRRSLGSILP